VRLASCTLLVSVGVTLAYTLTRPTSGETSVARPEAVTSYWRLERRFVDLQHQAGRLGARVRHLRWQKRRLGSALASLRSAHRQAVRTLQARVGGVDYAIRFSAAVTGVSESELRAVGSCESDLKPWARNGIYRGVMQEGPMFEASPLGRAGFSVWDPLPNVMTAAMTVAREGWSQWECRP